MPLDAFFDRQIRTWLSFGQCIEGCAGVAVWGGKIWGVTGPVSDDPVQSNADQLDGVRAKDDDDVSVVSICHQWTA